MLTGSSEGSTDACQKGCLWKHIPLTLYALLLPDRQLRWVHNFVDTLLWMVLLDMCAAHFAQVCVVALRTRLLVWILVYIWWLNIWKEEELSVSNGILSPSGYSNFCCAFWQFYLSLESPVYTKKNGVYFIKMYNMCQALCQLLYMYFSHVILIKTFWDRGNNDPTSWMNRLRG